MTGATPNETDRAARAAKSQPIHTDDADIGYLRRQVLAIQRVLIRRGVLAYQEVLDEIHRFETLDHSLGARVVAHAWEDLAFKQRLLQDGKAACAELGIDITEHAELQVVENTDRVHHVVVCTTCSCTPTLLIGVAPDWYKSTAYRTRVMEEPREVLAEFGVDLDEQVEVRVVDTTRDRRCLVLPVRPPGSEGLSESQLAELVTRNSMIGAGEPAGPVGG